MLELIWDKGGFAGEREGDWKELEEGDGEGRLTQVKRGGRGGGDA